MKKDYTNYTAEELLQDDYFIQSIQNPTEESKVFWNQRIKNGVLDRQEYQLAVFFLESVRVKRNRLSPDAQASLWKNIETTNNNLLRNKARRFHLFVAAAACMTLLISLSVSYWYTKSQKVQDLASIANTLKPIDETDDIQLILPNKHIPISEQNSTIQYDSTGVIKINSEKVYVADTQTSQKKTNEIQYTQLIVPNGKRSTLMLEDGSKLWVNAGSRIVYPAKFEAKKREIYVDGEVYLEVFHDENRPFIVKTDNMDVKVLGTSFNIMAYEKDELHTVVLVNGSVQVNTEDNQKTRLTPNKMLSFSEGICNVKDVDVTDYISWKEGLYKYERESLSIILDRLTRYYGKNIEYDSQVSALKCSGKLDMQEDLEVVLSGLCQTAPICYEKGQNGYSIGMSKEI